MKAITLVVLVLVALLGHGASAARILALLMTSRSHLTSFTALTAALAERGHEVTLVSNYQPFKHPNQTHLDLGPIEKAFESAGMKFDTARHLRKGSFDVSGPFGQAFGPLGVLGPKMAELRSVSEFGRALSGHGLARADVREVLDKPAGHYDAVILEVFFGQEFLVGLGHKLKAPVISVNSLGEFVDLSYFSGAAFNPAFRPQPMLDLTDRMNFKERLLNTLYAAFFMYHKYVEHYPEQQRLLDLHFPGGPPLTEQLSAIDLHVINSHYSLSYPTAAPPSHVLAGGMHIKEPKPLPENLKTFLDGAEHGVVYFCLGSILKASDMPEVLRDAFLETFRARKKERFLVKWNAETPKNAPPNVLLQDWLPQSDILAHPNVRVFITHGGLLGSQEALYRGVPVIGIPRFGDQRFNVRLATRRGYGVELDLANVSRASVAWALREVLDEPRYAAKARAYSELLRAEPVAALDKAVFWVEHVMRRGGGAHLRPSSVAMPLHQLLLLDVILAVATPLLALALVVVLAVRALVRRCCRRTPAANSSHDGTKKKRL